MGAWITTLVNSYIRLFLRIFPDFKENWVIWTHNSGHIFNLNTFNGSFWPEILAASEAYVMLSYSGSPQVLKLPSLETPGLQNWNLQYCPINRFMFLNMFKWYWYLNVFKWYWYQLNNKKDPVNLSTLWEELYFMYASGFMGKFLNIKDTNVIFNYIPQLWNNCPWGSMIVPLKNWKSDIIPDSKDCLWKCVTYLFHTYQRMNWYVLLWHRFYDIIQ